MKKTMITLTAAATVGLGTVFGGLPLTTEAASISSLKGEQNKIQSQRSELKSGINDANAKINDLQNQENSVHNEISRIEAAINDTTSKINQKTAKIDETKAEIAKLQEDIKALQERIEKRSILLKDRVRSYQENGTVINYLDVLLGSQNFSDFIDRASAVATFMQADQDILKQHEADKAEVEEKQKKVESDLASLENMVADLKKMNDQLSAQRAEKDNLLAIISDQKAEAQEYVVDMQEQEQILAAQEAAIQKSIKSQEAAAASAAAAAAAAAAASAAAAAKPSGNVSNNVAVAPPVSGGSFTRPTAGIITSGFGGRDGSFHYGVDIAKAGTVPIVAAADGEVYVSHFSSSYGNVVYILHNINGQYYTTVYAHMSTRMVGEGTTVKKGQQIGVMGNTGDSHGQHLHFELYRGKWQYHAAINPVGIVPL